MGQSFYSQQQKVRGTENANVGVSAEEQTYKPVSVNDIVESLTHCIQMDSSFWFDTINMG